MSNVSTARVQEVLQHLWDQHADSFAVDVAAVCGGNEVEEDSLLEDEGRTHHTADDVWLNLDHCAADDSAGIGYLYGWLMALDAAANKLGLFLRRDFPTVDPETLQTVKLPANDSLLKSAADALAEDIANSDVWVGTVGGFLDAIGAPPAEEAEG